MKTTEDLYLLDEWQQWSLLWNKMNAVCRFTVCLSQQTSLSPPDEPLGLHYALGRIQKNLNALPSDTYQIYVCGGKNFVVDTKEFVLANYPQSEVFVERFN
jgi:NAD(P)H-flavin reductase